MNSRLDNWPSLLAAYVQTHREAPFEWGVHDCATFAAGAVRTITGEDRFSAPYVGLRAAGEYMDSVGGVAAHATALLGPPVPPMLVKSGDVALLDLNGRDTLSVCLGETYAVPGPEGLVLYRRSSVKFGWSI